MRPRAGEVEVRSVEGPAPEVSGRRLRGLIPYGVQSRDLGGWREVMTPGCLAETDLRDLVATLNHDVSRLLGRHPATLDVEDRGDGLHWSCELPTGPTGEDVRVAVERGDLRSTSWRMVVGRDRWEGALRHVERVAELRDVAVVTTPAYADAVAELRAAPEPEPDPQSHEDAMPEDTPTGLHVEDRSADDERPTIEARMIAAMLGVPPGEARDLTHATAQPVEREEVAAFVFDALRPASVVLATGVPVRETERRSVVFPTIVSDVSVAFYNELEEISESDPVLAELEIEPRAIKGLVRGSSEAFEDAEPDLLDLVTGNLATQLALRLDAECLVGNTSKGFKGLTTMPGTQTLSVGGGLTSYDAIIKAAGLLAEANVPGPYAVLAHPRVLTTLDLLKTDGSSNEALPRPAGVPPIYAASQLGVSGGAQPSTTVVVFAPGMFLLVRRRDVTVEVDRSEEFSKDAILVRGKLRAALGTAHPEAAVKLTGVAAPPIS